ncbi:InlB B-repeat-containing protein, partial [Aristaeella lactis]
MKYSVKKLTAWILTLMMLISSMPVDALASIGTIRQENEIIDISDAVQVYGDLVTNKVTSRDGFSVKVESHKKDLPVNGEVKFRTLRMAKAVTPVADGGRRELGSYDIEIWNNDLNEEWQPEAGETVDVTVSLPAPLDVNKGEKLYLIHDPEGRNEDVHATFYVKNDQVTGFSFKATGFSVYAVVAAPDPDALLHVVFKYNAEANAEQIADMYVKQSDNMNQVLFDPSGLIEKDDEAIFKGWTTDPNYTVDTAALTMDNIRAAVEGKFPLTAEDTEVVYYPILVKQYTINYLDPNAVSLGMHTIDLRADDNDPKPYTIEMAYTPQDDTHSFEGWNVVSGDEYIAAAEGGTLPEPPYPNKTNVTVSGNVTFQVESPEGSWLIFHQNGKGGTYNAPQFLQYEDLLEDVSILPMTRRGYTFGGWYTDAACTDGNEFVFEGTIETRTEIYAKWIPNEEAAYTVVFWTQNLSRTGYEVGASYVKTKAQVGTIIPYSFVDNVDEDYVTSPDFGNSMGHFTGFCLTENSKNQQVTIEPEGDTVLNLYYDRIVYNFKFYLYRDADQNNRYDYANNSGGGSDLNGVVTWHSNQTQKPSVTGYTEQSETVNGRTYHYFVMQAYYGEDISSKWPTYDKITGANGRDAVSFVMMVGTVLKPSATTSGSGTVKGVISVLNENILGATNNANGNYVVIRFPGSYYNWRYHIWFEAVDGEDYTGKTLRTYNGRTYYEETVMEVRSSNTEVSSQNEPKYTGFDFVEKRGQNWNNSNYWTTGNNPTLYHLNYVYNRQEFKISYFDGEYVNGDNGHMANHSGVLLHESPDIGQGATIADEYKNYKPTQSSEPGYTFDGWYLDEACTTPYVWGTMPVGGIKVYAKWRQIQYRVFLQMNPPAEGVEVDWGSSVINDNFRKEIGGSVSVYTGIAAGYAFVGWYNHKDGSLFDADITSLDDSITEEYPLDEKRAYGDGNRFWINRKLVLYPKWRVALVGADGINVVYDREDPAVGGTGTIKGGKYVDTAEANAIPGVAAPKAGYQFAYWIMKKPDGSEYEDPIYAGQPFTVLAENAVEERLVDENGNAIYVQDAQGHYLDENGKIIDEGAPGWENDRIQRREYTITLRAKYIPIEGPASTHISWFMNDGTEAFHTDGDEEHPLQVNVGVDVQNAPARDGYQFIGWAFVPEDGADSETWESNSENWTQNLTEPDIYYQDGHYYKKDTETEITQIAADENLPYDAVFAVWQPILKVEITGNKDTKTYNGSEQSVTGFTVKYKVGDGDWTTTAPEGVSVALASGKAAEAKGTDVDTYPMGLDKTFFTVNPGNNVFNAEEDLTVTDGELEITPASVTLTANSDTKTYTGTEQTATGYTCSVEGLSFTGVSASGSGTNVGEYDVTFEGVTINETKDSTGNYVVTGTTDGKLIINPAPVTIKTGSDEKEYDGTPLTKAEASITGLVNNETATVTATGSQTEVGSSTNTYSIDWGTTNKDNYTVTEDLGTLTVTANTAEVTLTAPSDEKTYDGT